MRNSSRFYDPCCDESISKKSVAKDVLCEKLMSASITGRSRTNSRILAWKCWMHYPLWPKAALAPILPDELTLSVILLICICETRMYPVCVKFVVLLNTLCWSDLIFASGVNIHLLFNSISFMLIPCKKIF